MGVEGGGTFHYTLVQSIMVKSKTIEGHTSLGSTPMLLPTDTAYCLLSKVSYLTSEPSFLHQKN